MKKMALLLFLTAPLFGAGNLIHVVPHSHWDREWYLPFDQQRMRLIDLLDEALQKCEKNPDYYFLTDGQSIVFEDYLAIRPENRERLRRAILAGQLSYGPQYILPDTYLADGESQVRNHLMAILEAEQWTGPLDATEPVIPDFFLAMGYFPDTFGNTAQSPQILKEFGFTSAIVGRGFPADRMGDDFLWQAPDGSTVLTYQFPDWYCNGKDLTADVVALAGCFHNVQKHPVSSHRLLMNGCDHQPVQKNLSAVMASLNQGQNDSLFYSTPMRFIQALQNEKRDRPTFVGEARNQHRTNGLGLEDVYSTRLYLKQANHRASHALLCYAEPLAALAHAFADAPYPKALLGRAWKLLLQNQVHDDICGCSVDAVHQDMMIRFRQVQELCEPIMTNALTCLLGKISIPLHDANERALVVFNPTPYARNEMIEAQVDFPEAYTLHEIKAVAADGSTTPCRILSTERAFSYQLPDDHFRIPFYVTRVHLHLLVSVPSFGYTVYRLSDCAAATALGDSVLLSNSVMENKLIKLSVQADGRYSLTDKMRGTVFPNLGAYEWRSDVGDEYNFRKLENELPLLLPACSGRPEILRNTGLEAALCFTQTTTWPTAVDRKEKARVGASIMTIKTVLTLRRDEPFVRVRVEFENRCQDYRLRVLLPTALQTEVITSEDDFGMTIRPVNPVAGFHRDSYSLPQGVFSYVADNARSLTILNKGLTEIEPKRTDDGSVLVGLTLLRCVGELGDWGYFPTPEAQCPGRQIMEFALLPGAVEPDWRQIYAYVRPLFCLDTKTQQGTWPMQKSFMTSWPAQVILSAVKKAEKRDELIVRGFNLQANSTTINLQFEQAANFFQTDLAERRRSQINSSVLPVAGQKIFSIEPTR